jgi:hypothetical protein
MRRALILAEEAETTREALLLLEAGLKAGGRSIELLLSQIEFKKMAEKMAWEADVDEEREAVLKERGWK